MANTELTYSILNELRSIINQLEKLRYQLESTLQPKQKISDQPILTDSDYQFYMQLELDKGWNIDTSYQMKFNFDNKEDKDFNSNDVGC